MNQDLNLDAIEQEAYRSYWEDGLIDVFVGSGIFAIGLTWMVEMIPLTALVPVLLMPLWPLARKRITVPRVGHVRFSQERANREKGKLKLFTMLGVGLFTMSAAAGVFFYFQMGEGSVDSLFGIIVPGLPCFLLGLMVVLGGSMIGRRQFTVYAIILVITGMAGIALEIEPFVQLVIGGGVMLLIGITLLIRFIQKYPIQKGTL